MRTIFTRRLAVVAGAVMVTSSVACSATQAAPPASDLVVSAAVPAYTPPSGVTNPCSAASPGAVGCAVLTAALRTGSAASMAADTTPAGYTPADLQAAYDLQGATGGSLQTVAVVTAYNDPDAASDLAAYRSQYGLTACTVANGCFKQVSETGSTSSLPGTAAGWSAPAAVSMDMISAVCPNCHILLVEASTTDISDLGTAENEAVSLGATAVDNDWMVPEAEIGSQETSYDSEYFDHPGVAITAPAGNSGYGVNYPAASQYVTAVGGTTLTADSSAPSGYTQTAWTGSGSGCSAYEPKPSWQTDTGCANRTLNDLAADADPSTPVAYYDTPTEGGWGEGSGTAVAAALIAGGYALAGTPAAGTYPASYPYEHPGGSYTTPGNAYPYTDGLDNITAETGGGTVSCTPSYLCNAGTGYNGPTGLGSPAGDTSLTSDGLGGHVFSGVAGMCLDDEYADTDAGNKVQIYDCNSGNSQIWTAEPDGTIRFDTSSYCLNVSSSSDAYGLLVDLESCDNANPAMEWTPLANGALYNPGTGACLDDPDSTTTNGSQLDVHACNGTGAQQWDLPYTVPAVTGQIFSTVTTGVCIDNEYGDATPGNKIELYTCNSGSSQQWTIAANGTLQVNGGCMDLAGGATGNTTLIVWEDCDGESSQHWVARADGSLINTLSGTCLADPNGITKDLTQLEIYTCENGTFWSWGLP